MKNIKHLSLIALLTTSTITPALSQSTNFAGPSMSIYGSNIKSSTTNTTLDQGEDNETLKAEKTKLAYGIDAAYTFGIQKDFFVALGLSYQINDTSFGSFTDQFTDVSSYETTKAYSLYISPMFALNNNTAVFLKGSLNTINIVETYNGTVPASTTDIEIKNKFGYGFGIQHMINKNVFAKLEYEKIDFGSKDITNVKYEPETQAFKIGIGYKF
jgi:opacity protein-like surface antigen